ncbi:Slp family lipoprotein [Thiolapillus sp.]
MKKVLYLSVISLWLAGCASNIPQTITEAPAEAIFARQVQQAPDAYNGKQVRWGGEVLEVANTEQHTDVLVLGRELKNDGEPVKNSPVDARFIARFPGFREPSEFPQGQRITVSGVLSGVEVHNVGEYPYSYPVVNVSDVYRWPKKKLRDHYPYYPYPPYYGWRPYPGWPPWWAYPDYPYWW